MTSDKGLYFERDPAVDLNLDPVFLFFMPLPSSVQVLTLKSRDNVE